MRLIDADAVFPWYLEAFKCMIDDPGEVRFSMNDIRDNLDNMPTVDAVEVVRCKDCIYFKDFSGEYQACERNCFFTTPTHYCAIGKRREETVNYEQAD